MPAGATTEPVTRTERDAFAAGTPFCGENSGSGDAIITCWARVKGNP